MPVPALPTEEAALREKAWLGDAVLALFARQWLLTQPTRSWADRTSLFTLLTSNAFLSGTGEPTRVEATIGLIYEAEGLPAAFAYIERELLPRFRKQALRQGTEAQGRTRPLF